MTIDIVERLRKPAGDSWTYDPTYDVRYEAATEIETLRAELAELRAGILWATGLGEAQETTVLRAELAATKARLGEAVWLFKVIYVVGYFRDEISAFLNKEEPKL